jgi:uncharacterized protein YsxB (DUF464 family)
MLLVKVELPFIVDEVMVSVVVHHRIWIENQLQIDSDGSKGDLGVTFSTSICKAKFSLLLRPVSESRVANLVRSKENNRKLISFISLTFKSQTKNKTKINLRATLKSLLMICESFDNFIAFCVSKAEVYELRANYQRQSRFGFLSD